MTDPLNAAAPVPPSEIHRDLEWVRGTKDDAVRCELFGRAAILREVERHLQRGIPLHELQVSKIASGPDVVPPSPRAWRESPEVSKAAAVVQTAIYDRCYRGGEYPTAALDALCDAVANCGPVTHEGT